MEMFNLTDMRQALETQVNNPVELNRMGLRMLESVDEMNKTIIDLDDKLEAELKERGCKVPQSKEAPADSPQPTTPIRLPPLTTPGAPILPRRIRRFNRSLFKPTRLNFDSPPSSPEKVEVSPNSPAASRKIPTPQAPLRPRRISRIDKSRIRPQCLDSSPQRESASDVFELCTPSQAAPTLVPQAPKRQRKAVNFEHELIKRMRYSLNFSPERRLEHSPANNITPVRASRQICPSTPVRSKETINFDNWNIMPIPLRLESPPSSPEPSIIPVLSKASTPVQQAPTVAPQAPVQPKRMIKMDHFTASPIRLSFDFPAGSPQRPVLQQNQKHFKDMICTPKDKVTKYMKKLIGAPVRPRKIGRFSVLPIRPHHVDINFSPECQAEADIPVKPATPDRRPFMVIPEAPKKNLIFQDWNIEPIPFSLGSNDE